MNDERTIGHYRVLNQLGAGAMGAVYAAVDTFIDRPVAIKSLRPELSNDPEFVSRFRAEAKSLALLNHPNIATLFSPMLEGGELYMVMELVRGKGLDEVLQARGRPLGVKEALAIVAQATDGLSYAHEMGVIHRDIKPSNLMIADGGRVKIMDFGIARVHGSARLTRTGMAVGTPLYMSPEQCRGAEGDERSDIYSLGIVLYELLNGTPPFSGETEYELIQAQIGAVPPPLVPKAPGVTPALEANIMKAIAKKPENRFASMREFSDSLGATAMRPDATGYVRNADYLISTSQFDAEKVKASAADVAKSRLMGASRVLQARGAAFKATIATVFAFAAGAGYLAWRGIDETGGALSQGPKSSVAPARVETPAPPKAVARNPDAQPQAAPVQPAAPAQVAPVAEEIAKPLEIGAATAEAMPPAAPPPAPAQTAATIGTLRTLIKGSGAERIRAADFAYVSDSVKLQAFETAMRLAAGGSSEAQFVLGMLFLDTPEKKDVDRAFTAFSDSAKQNYPDAQENLASMYQNGAVGGRRDPDKAGYWHRLAAENGDAKAQYWLGCYYQYGWGGLAKDRAKASEQFNKSASAGYQAAKDALAALAPRSRTPSPCVVAR